ncbi:MAG TPA: M23 family metallopeptidase [Solirubrobacterales bacterium]|nr:M23 family metallopeptidase [Solirubrobacterales bacterium]
MQAGHAPGGRGRAIARRIALTAVASATAATAAAAAPSPAQANLRLAHDNAYSQYQLHPRVLIWGRAKPMRYAFEIGGQRRRTVRVIAVHKPTGRAVKRWRLEDVAPGDRRKVRWKGFNGGNLSPGGRYFFRIVDVASGQTANRERSSGKRFFDLRYHQFPVAGDVGWGDGWGAGRNHKGQDLFANCGRPIRAARAGKVIWKRYQGSGAGYYLVIRGRRNNRDYVYMHLRKRRPVKLGERVKTGQRIGFMGQTGNASGCHLHFEVWKGRWFDGGRPMKNVAKQARRWRQWS